MRQALLKTAVSLLMIGLLISVVDHSDARRRTRKGSGIISTQQWLTEIGVKNQETGKPYTLKELKGLEGLYLGYNKKVKNISLLKHLPNLTTLDLTSTQVRDITPLKGMTNLETLDLRYTKVSKKDLKDLKKALPNCQITSNW